LKSESKADYDLLQALAGMIQKRGDSSAGFFSDREQAFYCAIRPLMFIAELGAVVMEELEARPLRQRLLKIETALQPAQQNRLEHLFNHAGRWLRVYHEQLGSLHDGPFVSDQVYANFESAMAQIEAAGWFKLDSVRAAVKRAREKFAAQQLPHGRLHWDFHCANILVTADERLGVLDFRLIDAPVYVDIARLMTDLQTYRLQVLSYGWFLRAEVVARFHAAIVRGYFGDETPHRAALYLYGLFAILEKWQTDEEMLSEGRGRSLQSLVFWRRRYFRRLLAGYVHKLEANG
jgi:hypothetical protein